MMMWLTLQLHNYYSWVKESKGSMWAWKTTDFPLDSIFIFESKQAMISPLLVHGV